MFGSETSSSRGRCFRLELYVEHRLDNCLFPPFSFQLYHFEGEKNAESMLFFTSRASKDNFSLLSECD